MKPHLLHFLALVIGCFCIHADSCAQNPRYRDKREIIEVGRQLYNLTRIYDMAKAVADTAQDLYGPIDGILPYKIDDSCYGAIAFCRHLQNRIVLKVTVSNINTDITPTIYTKKSVLSLSEDTLLRMLQAMEEAVINSLPQKPNMIRQVYMLPVKVGNDLEAFSFSLDLENGELGIKNDMEYQFYSPDSVVSSTPLHPATFIRIPIKWNSTTLYACLEPGPIRPTDVCRLLTIGYRKNLPAAQMLHEREVLYWDFRNNTGSIMSENPPSFILMDK